MAMLSPQESATPGGPSPVDAAMEVVRSAERVSVEELPDGGIAFEVEPGPHDVWKVPLACIVVGAIGIAAGYMLHSHHPGLPQGSTWRGAWKLMGIGALLVGMGPVFLLILVMQGPPRKAAVEARPGSLRADRSIGGDRVVSAIRKGDQQVIPFGDREVNVAIATLLASRLWQGDEIASGPAPGVNRWIIGPRARVEC